jgi:CelD/BcsL family acetyltransferase involved in cellulose biosynthesis
MMRHARDPLVADLPLAAVVVDGATGFAPLRADWQALFNAVEGAVWSCDPMVFETWRAMLRPKGGTAIIAVRDGAGRLRGLMPLMRDHAWRGPAVAPRYDYDPQDRALIVKRRMRPIPVRQMTTMASLPATMLWVGPLCQPEDMAAVQAVMARAMLDQRGWDVAVMPAIEGPEAQGWCDAFAAQGIVPGIQTLGRVVQDLQGLAPFQDVVNRQKKKFRQNVRRAQADAGELGVSFAIHEGADAVAAQFAVIASLARASWKHEGRAETDVHIAYDGPQQAYFERLLVSPDLGAVPVLGIASDAQGPVAVLLMLRHGSSITALLTFWNGRQPLASPGLLLLGTAIDWAAAQGLRRFDFNATAPWVRYIVDAHRTLCHVVVFAPTWRGRLLQRLSRFVQRLR